MNDVSGNEEEEEDLYWSYSGELYIIAASKNPGNCTVQEDQPFIKIKLWKINLLRKVRYLN